MALVAVPTSPPTTSPHVLEKIWDPETALDPEPRSPPDDPIRSAVPSPTLPPPVPREREGPSGARRRDADPDW